MASSSGLVGADSEVTVAIGATDSGNLHREDIIVVTLRNGKGDISVIGVVGEVIGRVTYRHTIAAPGIRQRDALVAIRINAAVKRVEQCDTGLGVHIQGVAGHILIGGLVGPVSAELGQVDVSLVSGQHHGSKGLELSSTVDSHNLVLGIGIAQGDSSGVGAAVLRAIGYGDDLAVLKVAGTNAGSVNGEATARVIERQGDVAGDILTLHGEGGSRALLGKGFHIQGRGAHLDARTLQGRLDADHGLLVSIKVIVAVAKGIQCAPVVTVAAPTEVDVELVGAAVITVNIEGVTAVAAAVHSTEHDGTLGKNLGLEDLGPLSIGVKRLSTAIGAGLLHHLN